MIEFDVDMGYLLDYDELDKVVLNDENGEHEPMEFVPVTATAGNRSCASCPEADNPDSYISHLQSALKWHDEHVPRPTNPRNTCVVLQGERPPEEVLFVRKDGEVTHYLPEGAGTCKLVDNDSGPDMHCTACGGGVDDEYRYFMDSWGYSRCPHCGARIIEEEAE